MSYHRISRDSHQIRVAEQQFLIRRSRERREQGLPVHFLHALSHDATPRWLREMPTVEILRQTWVHQLYTDANGQLRLRQAKDLPPAGMRVDSSSDPEAHCGKKRSMTWTGYKVHLTEPCEPNTLHVSTHVETTEAAVSDVVMTTPIQQALAAHQLSPDEHVVDAG